MNTAKSSLWKKISVTAVGLAIIGTGAYVAFIPTTVATEKINITVYKSPTCGCCKKWVSHLEKSGFNVKAIDKRDMRPVKKHFGVEGKFQSCHTAKVGKYFIEGHVPANDIKKLLSEKPDVKGLAVPGMPMGSPGMEGHRKDKYSVVSVDKNNNAKEYSKY